MNLNEVVCKDGGILKELYKSDYQINMRTILPHTKVGEHKHLEKNEWWFLYGGKCIVRLEYPSGGKKTFHTSITRPIEIEIPCGTGHEIENIDNKEAVLIYVSDKIYDPNNPDKEEWSWNE